MAATTDEGAKAAYERRHEQQTYAGVLSFLRSRYSRDLAGVEVAVTGIPLDLATTHRPGARFGPAAVRAASRQLSQLPAFPFGFNPLDLLDVVDYGDCYFDHGHPMKIPDIITDHIRTIVQAGVSPLSMGGDHFVTYPILRAVAEKHGPVSLVHFDAHSDTWPDDGVELNHGSMFTRAVNEGLVVPERSIQIGLRTWNDEHRNFNILDAIQVHGQSLEATIARTLEVVGDRPAYLTFDIDCLDPAFAPGTGTPVSGGLTNHQALTILRGLGAIDWVGMDIVEVAPAYDIAEITSLIGATIAHDYLCLLAAKKREKAA
ncbi:MAG: agmatinase [Rhodospirillales bacterium]